MPPPKNHRRVRPRKKRPSRPNPDPAPILESAADDGVLQQNQDAVPEATAVKKGNDRVSEKDTNDSLSGKIWTRKSRSNRLAIRHDLAKSEKLVAGIAKEGTGKETGKSGK